MARAVFLTGYWRSGTNGTVAALGKHSDIAVYNEGDNRVFENWRLKNIDVIRTVYNQETKEIALFKPVCEPYRIKEFLNLEADSQVIYIFRRPEKVCRSGLKNFENWPKVQRKFLQDFFIKSKDVFSLYDSKHAEKVRDELKEIYREDLNDASVVTLRWIISNNFYMQTQLFKNLRVFTISYELLTQEPKLVFSKISNFLNIKTDSKIIEDIKFSKRHSFQLNIEPKIRTAANYCYQNLNEIMSINEFYSV